MSGRKKIARFSVSLHQFKICLSVSSWNLYFASACSESIHRHLLEGSKCDVFLWKCWNEGNSTLHVFVAFELQLSKCLFCNEAVSV